MKKMSRSVFNQLIFSGLLLWFISSAILENQKTFADGRTVEPASILSIEGWWGMADYKNACQDEDNQYRIALGRWKIDKNTGAIHFGSGNKQRIGLYDEVCNLSSGKNDGSFLIFKAVCEGEEEKRAGDIMFRMIDSSHVRLSIINSPWFELIRCRSANVN